LDWEIIVIIVLLLVIGYQVQETQKRVKAIKNQVARQSYSFKKIENDIHHLFYCFLMMAEKEETIEDLRSTYDFHRPRVFQHIVEDGFDVPDIMRGLEDPDIDDDPNFWAEDRMNKFGFNQHSED